jgi:hypothetical protein
MKPNKKRFYIVKKGNGKFYTRVESDNMAPYWPWGSNEFDTFEEAKEVLIMKKEDLDRIEKENEEVIVFELI